MSSPNPFVIDSDTLTGQLTIIRRAALGLGSNLGDRQEYLQAAVDSLTDAPEIDGVAVSPVYETEPVGVSDQPIFLNAVLVVETALSARILVERAQAVEDAYGRDRDVEPWGPRTLDVDLLALADEVIDEPDLKVPHPLIGERAFVLCPWSDIDPDFEIPGLGLVGELAAGVGTEGVKLTDLVLELPS
jgi:2-amino-4-hydroxy-6-hydroxymethyldihydropteridine diphosphokinase